MKNKILGLFVLIATTASFISCDKKAEESIEAEEKHELNIVTLTRENLEHVTIKTEPAKLQNLDMTLRVAGRVELDLNKTAHITPTLEGRVIKLNVDLNEKVKVGDSLATIESPELLGKQLLIKSPIDGTVVSRLRAVGELADKSKELVTISDLSSLWVIAEVKERDIAAIKVGQQVSFKVLAYPNKEFKGQVVLEGNEVEEDTRTLEVRIKTDNREGFLRPGMFADVSIVTTVLEGALVIADSALQTDGEEEVVFVSLDDHRFERRVVRVGMEQGETVQILEGIKAGEVIVTDGSFVLKSEMLKSEMGGD